MGKKRTIIIVGLPLFAKRLSEALRSRMHGWDVIHLDTYSSNIDKIKAWFLIPRADVIYSINGTLGRSKVFDLALKHNKLSIMHWVGTDVLDARYAFESGTYKKEFVRRVVHFCEVNWIQDELQEIGIDAEILNFASFDRRFDVLSPRTNRLKLLFYSSDARADFYGLPLILDLARKFPDIDFSIVGAKAQNFEPLPQNVETHGWVDNMEHYFDACHATIRFPKHDGLSNFVLESLARAKHVLYNYPYPNCTFCPSLERLEQAVYDLRESVKTGTYEPNLSGKQFVEDEFNSEHIFGKLIGKINSLLG
jgi:hypothetical protein